MVRMMARPRPGRQVTGGSPQQAVARHPFDDLRSIADSTPMLRKLACLTILAVLMLLSRPARASNDEASGAEIAVLVVPTTVVGIAGLVTAIGVSSYLPNGGIPPQPWRVAGFITGGSNIAVFAIYTGLFVDLGAIITSGNLAVGIWSLAVSAVGTSRANRLRQAGVELVPLRPMAGTEVGLGRTGGVALRWTPLSW
jgi:hypothetical protein